MNSESDLQIWDNRNGTFLINCYSVEARAAMKMDTGKWSITVNNDEVFKVILWAMNHGFKISGALDLYIENLMNNEGKKITNPIK